MENIDFFSLFQGFGTMYAGGGLLVYLGWKIVSKDNPDSFILGDAFGVNISGVITSAIITGVYITVIPYR